MKHGLWMGKYLEDYSREELYGVIETMDKMRRAESEQHLKDLEMFAPPKRRS